MEILEFIFQDFSHFIGSFLLLLLLVDGGIRMVRIIRGDEDISYEIICAIVEKILEEKKDEKRNKKS